MEARNLSFLARLGRKGRHSDGRTSVAGHNIKDSRRRAICVQINNDQIVDAQHGRGRIEISGGNDGRIESGVMPQGKIIGVRQYTEVFARKSHELL